MFFGIQVCQGPGFSGSSFFKGQVFEGPGFSVSRFLKVHIFQGPRFSEYGYRVRAQVFHGPDPGFTSSP